MTHLKSYIDISILPQAKAKSLLVLVGSIVQRDTGDEVRLGPGELDPGSSFFSTRRPFGSAVDRP